MPLNRLYHKRCVLCGSTDLALFHRVYDESFYRRNAALDQNKPFEIVRCVACKMVFVKDYLDPAHYGCGDVLDLIAPPPPPHIRHYYLKTAILNLIGKHHLPPKVLDVGCGFGQVIRLLSNEGVDCTGIEPSPNRVDKVSDSGVSIINKPFDQAIPLCGANFSIVLLDNVLEHIPHPKETLLSVKSLLAPNGFLIIVVPNLYDIRILSSSWRNRYRFTPVGHVNYFSRKTLMKMAGLAGFQMRKYCFLPQDLPRPMSHVVYLRDVFTMLTGFYPFGIYATFVRKSD